MSCTNVTITVTWTAPGAGEVHNMTIGYREQGSGLPYTTIAATSLGGAPGSEDIIVPCATCDGVIYEGYVQDDCGSPQVAWTAIVFPDGSSCFEYEWCCIGSSIVVPIGITNAGTEYTIGDVVTFIGGNPTSNAAATVLTVGAAGDILTFNVSSIGTFYDTIPTPLVTRIVPPTGASIDAILTVSLEDCPPIDYEFCEPGDPPSPGQVTLSHGDCYKECTTEIRYDEKVQVLTDAGQIDHFSHGLTGIDCSCDDHCKWVEITNNSGAEITFYWQTCGTSANPGTSYWDVLPNTNVWASGECIICDTIRVVGDPSGVVIECNPCI